MSNQGTLTTIDTSQIREDAFQFEAVKMAAKQDKVGWVLTLRLKTDEADTQQNRQFILDWVGSRYMITMARIADNEEAVVPGDAEAGRRLVTSAAMLCKTFEFQQFMVDKGLTFDTEPDLCAEALRAFIGIKSRVELKDNEAAQAAFVRLRTEFYDGKAAPPLEVPR